MTGPSRRDVLRWGGSFALAAGVTGLGEPTASAAARPPTPGLVPESRATTLWYPSPAREESVVQQGLPIGNGRLGGLVGGDPEQDFLYLTDASMWLGDRNDALQDDGQFSYDTTHFGSFNQLARLRLSLPGHAMAAVTGYRRALDLSNGLATVGYQLGQTRYRRESYVSRPDDVVVLRLLATGPDRLTGSVTIEGTHGETPTGVPGDLLVSISGSLPNALRYAAVVTAHAVTGEVAVSGAEVTFTGCAEVVIVACGGTSYVPDPDAGFLDHDLDPLAVASTKARAAARLGGDPLLATHVADYRSGYDRMSVDLGTSTASQRSLDTWTRLVVRGGGAPDPELEAAYLQFCRYLTITGSRGVLPMNLQGIWLETDDPAWFSDYHTDVNVEMNYWLADRAGLGESADRLADYCLSQLPSWTALTAKWFNDERNRFRNTSGRIAGWTIAFSTNIYGGLGWWWHPAGNAWLCLTLWQHFEYSQDAAFLRKIYPLLRGAAEFWAARLVTVTITDPATGQTREVLVDDHDWSPEQGPQDARGITYAQELTWALFGQLEQATALLGVDRDFAAEVSALREKLYLPVVSPANGWLEEWMSPDNLGEDQHRHLSPLIGFFPGDRITLDDSPAELVDGVRALLTARGMQSYGWANAWRSLCWSRLRDGEKAYQLVETVLAPAVGTANGTAPNLFDMYSLGDRTIFQIDANLGTPAAMLDMLLYSRPGVIELLPALPGAWAKSGRVTGIGARGGFTVDLAWRSGRAESVTVHSVRGGETLLRYGSWLRQLRLAPGQSLTISRPG